MLGFAALFFCSAALPAAEVVATALFARFPRAASPHQRRTVLFRRWYALNAPAKHLSNIRGEALVIASLCCHPAHTRTMRGQGSGCKWE